MNDVVEKVIIDIEDVFLDTTYALDGENKLRTLLQELYVKGFEEGYEERCEERYQEGFEEGYNAGHYDGATN